MATQIGLFETVKPEQQTTRPSHRIIIIDGHIIAQFWAGPKGTVWWTLYKGRKNDESDYAVWAEADANLKEAIKLTGESAPPIIRSNLRPMQSKGGWTTGLVGDLHVYPNTDEGYRWALRELACSIK